MTFPFKCTYLAMFALCAMGTSVEVRAQRFFFAHPGDNPWTSETERPGQEVSGTLPIPQPGNRFRLQIWFQAGNYWSGRYNGFYPMIGFDKSWTAGLNAQAIDRKIKAATADPASSIANLGSFSIYPGPGTASFNLVSPNQQNRGGRNPMAGTNNPFGSTPTSLRPYGVNAAIMTAQWNGQTLINLAAALNPGEKIRLFDFLFLNSTLAVGDTYGDSIGDREPGLMLYKCASDNWNGTRLGTSSMARFSNIVPCDGTRIAVRAYEGQGESGGGGGGGTGMDGGGPLPEPATILSLGLGAILAIKRRR